MQLGPTIQSLAVFIALAVTSSLWLSPIPGIAAAQQSDRAAISPGEAKALVLDALEGRGKEISLDEDVRADDLDFYFFEATWPNPTGSPVIGYFAVNRWTGDIWDQGCHYSSSLLIKERQAEIRKRAKYPTATYLALHKKKPIC